MRPQYEHEPHELHEPREARRSGAIRVGSNTSAACEGELTACSCWGAPVSRPNSPVPDLPSIVVDASFLESHVASRKPRGAASGRHFVFVALGAFLGGLLLAPPMARLVSSASPKLMAKLMGLSSPAASETPPAATPVPAAMPARQAPLSVSAPAPEQAGRIDQAEAASRVHRAEALRQTGQTQHAERLLASVLEHRPGYPPALAAMANLELDFGRAGAAVTWARRAVRSLPWSADNWQLLSDALGLAGLHDESTRARRRAARLRRR